MAEIQNEFEYYYNRVIDWAEVGLGGGVWGDDDHVALVWEMVQEEFYELSSAVIKKDHIKIRDGLADYFVTLAQLIELTGWEEVDEPRVTMTKNVLVYLSKGDIKNKNTVAIPRLMQMLCLCLDYEGRNYPVGKDLLDVLKSNDSKFPTVEMLKDQYGDNIIEAIKAASDWIESNSQYKGVTGEIVEDKVVFRSEDGKGKIVKPWCYVEPKFNEEANNVTT